MDGGFVLLVYPRNTQYYEAHTPLSIMSLGTYLERAGVTVEYFDERVDPPALFDRLLKRGPRLAGFSVIGGQQIRSALRLSRRAKKLAPRARVVWGGLCPTTLTAEVVAEPSVDYAAIGEGEETLLELFHAAGRGPDDERRVAGLAFQGEDGSLRRTPSRPPPDVESLPFVYQGKAEAALRRYLLRSTVREATGYEVSRGCPFLCTFCYSPGFHSNTRAKSPEKVAAELESMRRLGITDLDVYDDTLFGARRALFPAYLDAFERGRFSWIGNLRINMIDADLLGRLERSGCKWLYFGVESSDQEALVAMKKGFSAEDIRRGLSVMSRSRIPAIYSLIYGMPIPGEEDKLWRYLDFAEEIRRHHPFAEVQLQSYVPLPGTELYPEALRRGFLPPSGLEAWADHDHFGIQSPWLKDPHMGPKVYVSTFLGYRYRRHLSWFPMSLFAYPLHRLSLWRLKRRRFDFYAEGWLYRAFLSLARFWSLLRGAAWRLGVGR